MIICSEMLRTQVIMIQDKIYEKVLQLIYKYGRIMLINSPIIIIVVVFSNPLAINEPYTPVMFLK